MTEEDTFLKLRQTPISNELYHVLWYNLPSDALESDTELIRRIRAHGWTVLSFYRGVNKFYRVSGDPEDLYDLDPEHMDRSVHVLYQLETKLYP